MYHIIVNPTAGHGRSKDILEPLAKGLDGHGKEFEILRTEASMDARRMAKEACEKKSDGIIAIGGDRTLQEIVMGMRESSPESFNIPVFLGILPCGSGNDYALTYGGKQKFNGGGASKKNNINNKVSSCVKNIIEGNTVPIDLIRVSGKMVCRSSMQTFTENTCINIANIGLDARIVYNAAALKKKFGRYAYLAAAYKSISQHKNASLRIEADGKDYDGEYTLLALCNGQYYGGGLRISPSARLDDGLITLCKIEGMSRPKTMVLFPSILFEKHINIKSVGYINCKKVNVFVKDGEVLCIDGNLYEAEGGISFEIMPGALRMFLP